jgi:hypothetical protein
LRSPWNFSLLSGVPKQSLFFCETAGKSVLPDGPLRVERAFARLFNLS